VRPSPVPSLTTGSTFCLALLLLAGAPARAQLAVEPPEPPRDAGLPDVALWLERWLPVVGASSYSTIETTGDFLAHASDSVTAAGLDGCTLVLEERSVSTVRAERVEERRTVRVPLAELDTALVRPRIRRAGMMLTRPNVLTTGQLVVPLRSPWKSRFITVARNDAPGQDSLASEHLVPFRFAIVPAERSAAAIRRAAALCIALEERRREPAPTLEERTVFGQ
jgi:hypothetical protein